MGLCSSQPPNDKYVFHYVGDNHTGAGDSSGKIAVDAPPKTKEEKENCKSKADEGGGRGAAAAAAADKLKKKRHSSAPGASKASKAKERFQKAKQLSAGADAFNKSGKLRSQRNKRKVRVCHSVHLFSQLSSTALPNTRSYRIYHRMAGLPRT